MPTNKLYKKVTEIALQLNKLNLSGWETEMVIHDKKKKEDFSVKAIFKIKTNRGKKNAR